MEVGALSPYLILPKNTSVCPFCGNLKMSAKLTRKGKKNSFFARFLFALSVKRVKLKLYVIGISKPLQRPLLSH